MGATKRYFREQFRIDKIILEHEDASDFYLSCWQSGFSAVPLFCVRLILFLGCLGILIASVVFMPGSVGMWPIFMTHWGLVIITLASGLGLVVSIVAAIDGTIDTSTGLPWYIKLYWAAYCTALPIALFITIFYFAFLRSMADVELAINPIMDLFIHGINSLLMFFLMVTAQHPLHLLQFVYPLAFALVYMFFSIIYYFAGGTGLTGEGWIYPMLDWSNPGPTITMILAIVVALVILQAAIVGISFLRDYVTHRWVRKYNTAYFNE